MTDYGMMACEHIARGSNKLARLTITVYVVVIRAEVLWPPGDLPPRLPGLQGHAIKNQDLLIASGAISLRGSEGLSAVEEDMAAVRLNFFVSMSKTL